MANGAEFVKKKEPDGDSTITSFESRFKPLSNTDINLEYATGSEDDTAYALGV